MSMRLLRLFGSRPATAPVARERLQILLQHERGLLGQSDLLVTLREEILATPLLGIIPESQDVLKASNVGSPVTLNNADSAPARAYVDASRRLMGEEVAMVVPLERKGFMNRLLGRRAA